MAELIDKWTVVGELITLQNNYTFFKNEWDAERLCREIAKLERKIGKTQGLEVVRCKDCKHCKHYDNTEGICWCKLNSKFFPSGTDWHSFPEDGFCSYGERKGDGE